MEKLFPAELTEKFIVEKHVGGGSYGAIYKVIKKSNNKVYAMEAVTRNDSSSWKDIEIEMQVLSFVNPYKLHLDCFFVENDTFFMVVDYCRNGDLLKAVVDKKSRHEKFREDEIWKYFIQICFGLESLHYNEFIHRDLHLQNILLDENNNIKIADFGISRYLGTHSIQGVQAIQSPRTLIGKPQSKESDIWEVGYILYYLCTLKDPFNGNKNKIQHEPHNPISSEYSENLRYFVDWCLKKERRDRPTIIDILTHEFIVDKTQSLGIEIPQASIMNTVILQIELSAYRKSQEIKDNEIESLNLKLESILLEFNNEIIGQNDEINRLKSEIASLKNAKDDAIKTFRLKDVELANFLEKLKTLDEKQLVEVKNYIRALIADAKKNKKMLDFSEQDLNIEKYQIEIMTAQNLIDKRSKILKSSNSAELENDFRRTCSAYQNHYAADDASVAQAYQDYLTTYHQQTSLFCIEGYSIWNGTSNLLIYNTETETQKLNVFHFYMNSSTCITQLPNGKLFCFNSVIALLIDVNNYRVDVLPSGTNCLYSSAIFFNNSIYCFGGTNFKDLRFSSRFDLERNEWNELTALPKADYKCNSIIFNRSILISEYWNKIFGDIQLIETLSQQFRINLQREKEKYW